MGNHAVEASPQAYARIGRALYLVIIVLGAFAEGFDANKLIAPGDAATRSFAYAIARNWWCRWRWTCFIAAVRLSIVDGLSGPVM